MTNPFRSAALCAAAVLAVSTAAAAQKPHSGIRVSFDAAPTNHGSDNNGVNTGSSSGAAGGTFSPNPTPNANTPSAVGGAPSGGSGAPNSAGISLSITGNASGAIVTSTADVVAGLQTGKVTLKTSLGGTMIVFLPPATGAAIATSITNPSPANCQMAGGAVALTLDASNVPSGVVAAVSNAMSEIGSCAIITTSTAAVNSAINAVRAALQSGSLSADQATGLVAVLVSMRAGMASRP